MIEHYYHCRIVKGQKSERLNPKALSHRFFAVYPRPTAPNALPMPLAELKPRLLAPDETAGKAGTGLKRKAESPSASGVDRVARRLF